MDRREINPAEWLLGFNINEGIEVSGAERTLYLSGQTSTDSEGNPLHAGDLVAQFGQAWSNLKASLAAADMTPGNVVRLNMYTTDVPGFMAAAEQIVPVFAGLIVPLPLFPDWLQSVLYWLPFRGMADVPFRIYSGHIPVHDVPLEIVNQWLWFVVLVGFGYWLLTRARRNLVVQGG